MSYQVIARKWRPQTFEEVTGQEAITQTLRNAIEHDRLHHAYIFSGSRGVGKTTSARLLAKALNCHKTDKPNPAPCSLESKDVCVSCREIAESRSIDVFEFDAASHTGVDDIRELILEGININPARDRYKVFIIDEVHMLSNSSFNALLKTLEEPPPRVEFIMATTQLHKLPDTIVSRCQEFKFRSIPLNKIFERLKLIADAEKIDISDGALREIARSGEGSMRDAQSNFDQVISFSGDKIESEQVITALGIASAEILTRTLGAISENNPGEVLLVVDELVSRGQDLRNFCRDLLSFFRDLLVVKMEGDIENLLDTSILSGDELRQYAAPFTESDLIRFFNSLSETEFRLMDAVQPRYLLEIGLVKLIEMRRVTPIEQLLERLHKLESANSSQESLPANDLTRNRFDQPSDLPEKKTLVPESANNDVPFPMSLGDDVNPQNDSISEADQVFEDVETYEAKENLDQRSLNGSQSSDFITRFNANIVDSYSSDLSPITSEELEHIDDTWLDSAYEMKLILSGDDLCFIVDSSKLVQALVGSYANSNLDESENVEREISVGAAASKDFSHLIPQLKQNLDSEEIPEMPADPNDSQLLQFAENHPIVKKALRIFRGKIIDVKKI